MNEEVAMTDKRRTPENFDLRSHDIAEDKRQELLRLFPEIRTEGGKIDFDRLKLTLGEAVDVGKERYGLTWPGKADCFKTIQMPSLGTLRPCREESVNFDTTENLIIEGDNLEVLKLLQKSYLGKVKMIYIDPPYNTGNDFIYPDNYTRVPADLPGIHRAGGRRGQEVQHQHGGRWPLPLQVAEHDVSAAVSRAKSAASRTELIFVSIDDNEK